MEPFIERVERVERQKFAALLVDVLAFLGAFALAMDLRFHADLGLFEASEPPWGPMLHTLPVMLSVWLVALRVLGLYRVDRLRLLEEIGRLANAILVVLGILLSATFFYRGFSYSRGFTLLFIPLLAGSTTFGRLGSRFFRTRVLGAERLRTKVLLIGLSPTARHLARADAEVGSRHTVVGVLDNDAAPGTEVEGAKVLGRIDALAEIAKETGAEGIIIATSKLDERAQLELLDACLASDLEWQVVPNTYELMLDRVRIDVVAGVPVLGLRRSNIRGLNRLLKRLFDVIASASALLLLSPLMAAVAAAIKLSSRGPVFYTQQRIGERGRSFTFFKFRSMHVNSDDAIHRDYTRKWIAEGKANHEDGGEKVYKIKKDPRLIPIGGFIRKYSIDELPQLINVLKGDMSLIGPRPPIPYEVEVYREWHKRRLDGPQGITGLWQVSGRNRLSFDEMVKLDIEYLESWSLELDLKILWRTVGVVLFDRAY